MLKHKIMETLQKKIDTLKIKDAIYYEIKNQIKEIEEETYFNKEIETKVNEIYFYTKISGFVDFHKAFFQGSYDLPPDPSTKTVNINTIEPIVYLDYEDNEIPVNIDTEKLRKELNENLSY
jgi:hypothetical protein